MEGIFMVMTGGEAGMMGWVCGLRDPHRVRMRARTPHERNCMVRAADSRLRGDDGRRRGNCGRTEGPRKSMKIGRTLAAVSFDFGMGLYIRRTEAGCTTPCLRSGRTAEETGNGRYFHGNDGRSCGNDGLGVWAS